MLLLFLVSIVFLLSYEATALLLRQLTLRNLSVAHLDNLLKVLKCLFLVVLS